MKFVILGDSVKIFKCGQVVDEEVFAGDHPRLMQMGVIRVARKHEENLKETDAHAPPPTDETAKAQNVAFSAEIDVLRAENAALKEELSNAKNVPPEYDPARDQKLEALIADYNKMIADLQKNVADLQSDNELLRSKVNTPAPPQQQKRK